MTHGAPTTHDVPIHNDSSSSAGGDIGSTKMRGRHAVQRGTTLNDAPTMHDVPVSHVIREGNGPSLDDAPIPYVVPIPHVSSSSTSRDGFGAPTSNVSGGSAGGDGGPKQRMRQLTLDDAFKRTTRTDREEACGTTDDGGTKRMRQLSIDECFGQS